MADKTGNTLESINQPNEALADEPFREALDWSMITGRWELTVQDAEGPDHNFKQPQYGYRLVIDIGADLGAPILGTIYIHEIGTGLSVVEATFEGRVQLRDNYLMGFHDVKLDDRPGYGSFMFHFNDRIDGGEAYFIMKATRAAQGFGIGKGTMRRV